MVVELEKEFLVAFLPVEGVVLVIGHWRATRCPTYSVVREDGNCTPSRLESPVFDRDLSTVPSVR